MGYYSNRLFSTKKNLVIVFKNGKRKKFYIDRYDDDSVININKNLDRKGWIFIYHHYEGGGRPIGDFKASEITGWYEEY